MSTLPDPQPGDSPETNDLTPDDVGDLGLPVLEAWADAQPPEPPILTYTPHPFHPPRFPNVLDLFLVGLLMGLGFACAGGVTALALHFHLYGVTTVNQALTDIHYTLGSQVAWYCFTFLGCLLIFPLIWHTGFFRGVEWRVRAAFERWWLLLSAVVACIVLAFIDAVLLPGPKEAPIDQIFKMPGAAWLLFLFGITLAPFFEELGFRGFLLPALCTAWDWSVERIRHLPPRDPDGEGRTRWSLPAMVAGSVLTSIPFAFMHAPQTGYSFGPFVLLVCVSLVLCWVRLSTRSLAASTLVHASYNLLLFAGLLVASDGFRHMDKM